MLNVELADTFATERGCLHEIVNRGSDLRNAMGMSRDKERMCEREGVDALH